MIPLCHDFTDETVLVFGGGSVGARKARRFAREAEVVVLSPQFDGDGEPDGRPDDHDARADGSGTAASSIDSAHGDPYGGAERIRAAPDPGAIPGWLDLVEPALVVAATDDATVNETIADAASDRGILVNRADRGGGRDAGSVVVPATVREEPVVVAVSTSGTAPALSAHLRSELEPRLDGAGEMARALAALREELRSRDLPRDRRRELLEETVTDPAVWTALRTGATNHRQVIEDVLDTDLPPESPPAPDEGGDSA